MPQRAMQADDPAALAARVERLDETAALRQVTAAVSELAGRVGRAEEGIRAGLRSPVTRVQRCEALEMARDFITELGLPPRYERVHAELAVARYLTGE